MNETLDELQAKIDELDKQVEDMEKKHGDALERFMRDNRHWQGIWELIALFERRRQLHGEVLDLIYNYE